MLRKKANSRIMDGQLNLPFESHQMLPTKEIRTCNIVSFSSKVEEYRSKEEAEARRKSINRLLDYAEKLPW